MSDRYLQMEYWLRKSYFDPVEAYSAHETKESRKQKLASEISSYVRFVSHIHPQLSVAPSSRLLTLLQEALAYEKEHVLLRPYPHSKGILVEGSRLDLFHNCAETVILEEAVPTVNVDLCLLSDP